MSDNRTEFERIMDENRFRLSVGELPLLAWQHQQIKIDELLSALIDVIGFIEPTSAQGGVHFDSQTAVKKSYESAIAVIKKIKAAK